MTPGTPLLYEAGADQVPKAIRRGSMVRCSFSMKNRQLGTRDICRTFSTAPQSTAKHRTALSCTFAGDERTLKRKRLQQLLKVPRMCTVPHRTFPPPMISTTNRYIYLTINKTRKTRRHTGNTQPRPPPGGKEVRRVNLQQLLTFLPLSSRFR